MNNKLIDEETGKLKEPEIVLSLSGGAARGFMYVGMYKVLEEMGIKVKSVCATSMGSVVGLLIASGYSAEKITELIKEIDMSKMFDLNIENLFRGIFKGQKFFDLINKLCEGKNIEDLPIPYHAITACKTKKGWEQVVISKGSGALAVRASSSIPALFTPVEYVTPQGEKKILVDGGLADGHYPRVTHEKFLEGTELQGLPHLEIDALTGIEERGFLENITMGMIKDQQKAHKKTIAEKGMPEDYYLIETGDCKIGQFSFNKGPEFVEEGEKIARENLPKMVKSLFGITVEELKEHNKKLQEQQENQTTEKRTEQKGFYQNHTFEETYEREM